MSLIPGTRLGPYEVTAKIGEGGMGEVYKATDTRLDRTVAIKVLPERVATDPDLTQRFEQEARTVAALNHPHICTLHDVGTQDGIDFLVMEYLDGQTLAQRLEKGALPLDQTLTIAIEIADALDKAHQQGIVHRDLKPGNIMLTNAGAKLLDFGLAKLRKPGTIGAEGFSATTERLGPSTGRGALLGTPQYMAPEQLRGEAADARTDIFALGMVLYEMATGRRAFKGDSQASLIAAILEHDPVPMTTLQPVTPPLLEHVVRNCLAKEPDDRWQSARDVRRELAWTIESGCPPSVPGAAVVAPHPVAGRRTMLAGAAIAVALVAGVVAWTPKPLPVESLDVVRFQLATSDTHPFIAGDWQDLSISADGKRIVYSSVNASATDTQLTVHSLDQLEGSPLRGSDGAVNPFSSPDGQWVGFETRGTILQKISVSGGPPVWLCEAPAPVRGASWGADGWIIFGTRGGGLFRVPDGGGGRTEPLTTLSADRHERGHHWPFIIPGANAVLFVVVATGLPQTTGELAVLALDTGNVTRLGLVGTSPRYIDTGHLVYAATNGSVQAVPFDAGTLEVTGSPVPLVEDVLVKPGGAADFAISGQGRLVYLRGDSRRLAERTLVWVSRDGTEELINVPPRAYTYARLSPDGTRVALDSRDEDYDIWVWDLTRETLRRLTFDSGFNRGPVWSPDGSRIAFAAEGDQGQALYWQAADGSGLPEQLAAEEAFPTSFTPDGRHLIFTQPFWLPFDVGMTSLDDETERQMLLATPFSEANAEVSPDGRWLAYQSDESGEEEIYVRPFPDVDASLAQVSTGGGSRPLWSRDGTELFYYAGPNTIMAVPVHSGARLTLGRPEVVVQGDYARPGNAGRHYDVSADGQRFLLLREGDGTLAPARMTGPAIMVVLNWFEELKQRVPVD